MQVWSPARLLFGRARRYVREVVQEPGSPRSKKYPAVEVVQHEDCDGEGECGHDQGIPLGFPGNAAICLPVADSRAEVLMPE